MYNDIFLILFIIFLATSCTDKSNSSNDGYSSDNSPITIKIDKNNVNDELRLSSYVESVKYVPLETNDSSIIGQIFQIEVTEKNIFVLDLWSQKKLFMFKSDGAFIRTIGAYGVGPGEYTEISSFVIDEKTNTIFLLDKSVSVIEYSFEGAWIKTTMLEDFMGFRMAKKGEMFAFTGAGRNDKLILADNHFSKKESFFPFTSRFLARSITSPLQQNCHGKLLFRQFLNDTIYEINNNYSLKPHCIVDYGNKGIVDYSYFLKSDKNSKYMESFVNEHLTMISYYETNDFINVRSLYEKESFSTFFCKKSEKVISVSEKDVIDDISFSDGLLYFRGVNCSNNYFVQIIEPSVFLEKLGSNLAKSSPFYNEALSASKSLDETSNPIFIMIKLKNF